MDWKSLMFDSWVPKVRVETQLDASQSTPAGLREHEGDLVAHPGRGSSKTHQTPPRYLGGSHHPDRPLGRFILGASAPQTLPAYCNAPNCPGPPGTPGGSCSMRDFSNLVLATSHLHN